TLLEDIIKIKKTVDIEVECFVQGALCIAFSGNCYFSSFVSGYSGNRGKCMQLCRKKYSTKIGRQSINGYLLSAKDLMLGKKISKLMEAGVDCFKIEGRLRRPEYVAEAVRAYKKAICGNFDESDVIALKKVFNRGDYTDGHLTNPTNKVLDINISGHKGLRFGTVQKIIGKKATLSKALSKGDGIKFLRAGKEVGSASIVQNGFVTGFEGNVRVGDEVYITTDSQFNQNVLQRTKKLFVEVTADFDKSILILKCGNSQIQCEIVGAQPAIKAPITDKDLADNFDKSEHFTVAKAVVRGAPSFMTKADFNELRRSAYKLLIDKILADYNAQMQVFDGKCYTMCDIISDKIGRILRGRTIYQVENPEQISPEMELIAVNPREYSVEYLSKFKPYFDRALLNLPIVARGKDMDILREIVSKCDFCGFISNNLYAIDLVKDKPILLGFGHNIINDVISAEKIYSIESDAVLKNGYVYSEGNVPLMTFCHCEKKEIANGCENCKGYDITLSYENRDFYLRRYKIYYCYGQLLNCATLDIKQKGAVKSFVDYSYQRTNGTTKGNYGRGLK
ncbi:MAG: U32 family peptidase, partial [Clostridiales bacterium]|nr:U32 family peptidase [Clostridiales bacterium]